MRKLVSVLVAVCLLGGADAVLAQDTRTFAVEGRVGAGFPVGDFGEDDTVETGFGFGVNARYYLTPGLSVYAGWERFEFGVDTGTDVGVDVDASIIDQGFRLGGRYLFPLGAVQSISPFVEAGAILNQAELQVSGAGTSLDFESDRSLGFEVGAGVAIPLADDFAFTPAVRYRRYSPEFENQQGFQDSQEGENDISYIALDWGIQFRF